MLTPPSRATTSRALPAAGRTASPVGPGSWESFVGRRGTALAPREVAGERRGRDPTCRPLARARTAPLPMPRAPELGAYVSPAPRTARSASPASPVHASLGGSPKSAGSAGSWPWSASPASTCSWRTIEVPIFGVAAAAPGSTPPRGTCVPAPASPVQAARPFSPRAGDHDDDAHELFGPFDAWEPADERVAAPAHAPFALPVPETPQLSFARHRPSASQTGRRAWTATSDRGGSRAAQPRLWHAPGHDHAGAASSRPQTPMLSSSPLARSLDNDA